MGQFVVYSINPKQLDRYRDRFSLAGAKDDASFVTIMAPRAFTDVALNRCLNSSRNIEQCRFLFRVRSMIAAATTQGAERQ